MNSLIGIVPSRPGSQALTPSGGRASSADRLRELLGMSVDEFNITFPVRENVYKIKGGAPRAKLLRRQMSGRVFVLGREAWKALGFERVPFFSIHRTEEAVWVLLPHASGRNRMYNSPATRDRLRRVVCQHLSLLT